VANLQTAKRMGRFHAHDFEASMEDVTGTVTIAEHFEYAIRRGMEEMQRRCRVAVEKAMARNKPVSLENVLAAINKIKAK
jgi:hypothetical protein